ncbi:uncharacterized protein LOC123534423 [Mercenaria mercenaria]|uniref:uncharacterized protein LOC123534423 n=1 Tax=Mercenaria mercenaria TaxID=6596 RepID=UPI00234E85E1|nr:uncharacterized protein LOC123534423 [Mercenaria mercenaria]
MGNRHSSYKKKGTISRKHPAPQETLHTVDGLGPELSQEVDNNGLCKEPTDNILVTDIKQCPPTPCPAFYKKNDDDQPLEMQSVLTNSGYITTQWLVGTEQESCYTHEPAAMDKDDAANVPATESENGDVAVDTGASQCHEVDHNENQISVPFEDDGVYASIPPSRNTNDVGSYRTNSTEGSFALSIENPEYFTRGCCQRSSQLTNWSIADSAYTASSNNSDHNGSGDYFCFNCMACRAENMEYMIDVYKRTLQRDLRVEDILPDLHCIDDLRKEEIGKKSRESRRGAVDMLIESIKSSNEQGKWQNLIEALERSDYNFIVKLLKGETENDQEKNKQILSLMSQQLINNIHLDDSLDKLYAAELLNDKDKEDIESEQKNHGPIAAACKMFNIVPTRSHDWDKRLSGILDECGLSDVAKLLQFSQEPSTSLKSDETDPKKGKCSHSKHHYEKIYSSRNRHVVMHHNNESHGKTNDAGLSTETGKIIIDLRKNVQNIEEQTERHISAVKELKAIQQKDIQELKHAAGETREKMQSLNEQEIAFHSEIKTELTAQNKRIADMELQQQKLFDELKNSLLDIRCAIVDLTKLVDPSPPEACKQSERNMTIDSGFSGGSGSFPEEDPESQIYSEFGSLYRIPEEYNTYF